MINRQIIFRGSILTGIVISCFWTSCTKDVGRRSVPVEEHGYPENVGNIIVAKCATSGCHDAKSKDAAAGLNLATWNHLFEGSRGGSSVIPYRPDFSTLMFYINSYNEFGAIQLTPKMPFNEPALSQSEVKTIFDWIKSGAPDAYGNIKFGDNPARKKFYAANQGCDVVTVFDAETMLAMRYVDVGETRGIEAPHMIRVSPDNKHWFASFIAGAFFLKYRTSDNFLEGKVNLGVGSWNTFVITADSKKAFVIDWSSPGKIASVDLTTMSCTIFPGYSYPHGSALNKNEEFLYVTSQSSNYVYKFAVSDFSSSEQIVMDGTGTPQDFGSLEPHEILFSPDGTKYFVTCQAPNEIRVLQSSNDSLIAVIPTGEFPQEMAISKKHPYLFVSCMEDTSSNKLQLGSVSVINYQTLKHVKSIYAGFQSHGLAIDDTHNRVYVSNRNILSMGPSPHHQGVCSGRNGYITAISLPSLEMVQGFKAEVSIDPYGLGVTH